MLDFRVRELINSLEPEFRVPVSQALRASDGSLLSFQQELSAQTWDHPNLPVQEIIDRVAFDVV